MLLVMPGRKESFPPISSYPGGESGLRPFSPHSSSGSESTVIHADLPSLVSNGGPIMHVNPKVCESIRCEYGAICEMGDDGYPRCTCQTDCAHSPGNSICASDLKLYANECEMRREACHRQTELRPRPMELCEGMCVLQFLNGSNVC